MCHQRITEESCELLIKIKHALREKKCCIMFWSRILFKSHVAGLLRVWPLNRKTLYISPLNTWNDVIKRRVISNMFDTTETRSEVFGSVERWFGECSKLLTTWKLLGCSFTEPANNFFHAPCTNTSCLPSCCGRLEADRRFTTRGPKHMNETPVRGRPVIHYTHLSRTVFKKKHR